MMFKNAHASFYHYYSTNHNEPKWCKCLQHYESYDHAQHSIPRACMYITKPVFNDYAPEVLWKRLSMPVVRIRTKHFIVFYGLQHQGIVMLVR